MPWNYSTLGWLGLPSPTVLPDTSFGLRNVRASAVDGSVAVWNNGAGQWQVFTGGAWSAVGTFNAANPISAIGPAHGGRYLAVTADGGGSFAGFTTLVPGGASIEHGRTVHYMQLLGFPSEPRSEILPVRDVLTNRWFPGLLFVPCLAGADCFWLGIDYASGQPSAAILNDLNNGIYHVQGGNGSAGSLANIGYSNALIPGTLQLPQTVDAPAYAGGYVDFYNMSPGGFTGIASLTIAQDYLASAGGSPVKGWTLQFLAGWQSDASTPFMDSSPVIPSQALPGQFMTPQMRAFQALSLPVFTSSSPIAGVLSRQTAALPLISGSTFEGITFAPVIGGVVDLPFTIAPPAGLDTNIADVTLGMIGSAPFVLDSSGVFYVLAFIGSQFASLWCLSNWSYRRHTV